MESVRDKVQNWLMSEGWQIVEQPHPEMGWLIRAEDGAQRRILVGQSKAREDQIHLEARVNLGEDYRKKFEILPEKRRREILWKLRFRLLSMNVDFIGITDPMQAVLLTQRIYLDALTKDSFLQRFLTMRNAVITVIWSIIENLEDVEAPTESVKPVKH